MSDDTRLNKNRTKECPLVWAKERSLVIVSHFSGIVVLGRDYREERGRKKRETRKGNATRQKERNVSDKGDYKSREAAFFV